MSEGHNQHLDVDNIIRECIGNARRWFVPKGDRHDLLEAGSGYAANLGMAHLRSGYLYYALAYNKAWARIEDVRGGATDEVVEAALTPPDRQEGVG